MYVRVYIQSTYPDRHTCSASSINDDELVPLYLSLSLYFFSSIAPWSIVAIYLTLSIEIV